MQASVSVTNLTIAQINWANAQGKDYFLNRRKTK